MMRDECPTYVMEPGDLMTRKELMKVARSCEPHEVSRVMLILARVRLVLRKQPPEYIVNLPREMGFIKHATQFVAPGTMSSDRLNGLMALFVLESGACPELKEDALKYLCKHKGGWLMARPEVPEAYNYHLSCMVIRHPELLTDRERIFYDVIYRCGGLKKASQRKILITTGLLLVNGVLDLETLRDDHTAKCTKCRNNRSLTVLDADGVCLACTEELLIPNTPEGKSHMVQCCQCSCVYAVLFPVSLHHEEPKCFMCRASRRAPVQTCRTCSVGYYRVARSVTVSRDYQCRNCELHRTFETEISLRRLWDDNVEHVSVVLGVDQYLEYGFDVFSDKSLYEQRHVLELICDNASVPMEDHNDIQLKKLAYTYRGRVIQNAPLVFRTLRELF